jgi:hypothetical protein
LTPCNPYLKHAESPSLRRSAFAFLDILGYKEIVANAAGRGASQTLLGQLHAAVTPALTDLRENTRLFGNVVEPYIPLFNALRASWRQTFAQSLFHVAAFSDNIAIGYPVDNKDDLAALGALLVLVRDYQCSLMKYGFFVRGAIVLGDVYMDQNLIFGPALIEAYNAETTTAVFPRVILTGGAETFASTVISKYFEYASPPWAIIEIDDDGQPFVSYLPRPPADLVGIVAAFEEDMVAPYRREMQEHAQLVASRIFDYRDNPRVLEKYLWCARTHNKACVRYANWLGDVALIDGPVIGSRVA